MLTSLYNMYVMIKSWKIMFIVLSILNFFLPVHGSDTFVIREKKACSSLGSVYIASVNQLHGQNLWAESYHSTHWTVISHCQWTVHTETFS